MYVYGVAAGHVEIWGCGCKVVFHSQGGRQLSLPNTVKPLLNSVYEDRPPARSRTGHTIFNWMVSCLLILFHCNPVLSIL